MPNPGYKFSIIVPAYAEEGYIGRTLDKLHTYLVEQHYSNETEVIVVSADSQDKTVEEVQSRQKLFPHFTYVRPGPRVGKGRDVRSGVQAASGEYLLFMDADGATPLHHIKEAFELLENGADMVIGVRDIIKMHKTFLRRASSVLSNLVVRLFVGLRIPDSQCGFKGFRKTTADLLFSKMTVLGWGFDFELITIAKVNKKKIVKLAVPDWDDPKGVHTGLVGDSQLKAMLKTFKELIDVKRNQLKGIYRA